MATVSITFDIPDTLWETFMQAVKGPEGIGEWTAHIVGRLTGLKIQYEEAAMRTSYEAFKRLPPERQAAIQTEITAAGSKP